LELAFLSVGGGYVGPLAFDTKLDRIADLNRFAVEVEFAATEVKARGLGVLQEVKSVDGLDLVEIPSLGWVGNELAALGIFDGGLLLSRKRQRANRKKRLSNQAETEKGPKGVGHAAP